MEVFRKDKLLKQIGCEIKKNKKSMVSDLVDIYKIKDKNIFLSEVYDDYKSYYDYIVSMKKEQEFQILQLLHYLEKSMLEAGLTDKMVRQAKHEHNNILEKLGKVRNDLGELINKTEILKCDKTKH